MAEGNLSLPITYLELKFLVLYFLITLTAIKIIAISSKALYMNFYAFISAGLNCFIFLNSGENHLQLWYFSFFAPILPSYF